MFYFLNHYRSFLFKLDNFLTKNIFLCLNFRATFLHLLIWTILFFRQSYKDLFNLVTNLYFYYKLRDIFIENCFSNIIFRYPNLFKTNSL